jgi:hypothetical protein
LDRYRERIEEIVFEGTKCEEIDQVHDLSEQIGYTTYLATYKYVCDYSNHRDKECKVSLLPIPMITSQVKPLK